MVIIVPFLPTFYLTFAGEDALLIVNAFDKRVSGGVQIPVEDILGRRTQNSFWAWSREAGLSV